MTYSREGTGGPGTQSQRPDVEGRAEGRQREGSWFSLEHSCPEASGVHQVTLCVNRLLKAAAGLVLAQD